MYKGESNSGKGPKFVVCDEEMSLSSLSSAGISNGRSFLHIAGNVLKRVQTEEKTSPT